MAGGFSFGRTVAIVTPPHTRDFAPRDGRGVSLARQRG